MRVIYISAAAALLIILAIGTKSQSVHWTLCKFKPTAVCVLNRALHELDAAPATLENLNRRALAALYLARSGDKELAAQVITSLYDQLATRNLIFISEEHDPSGILQRLMMASHDNGEIDHFILYQNGLEDLIRQHESDYPFKAYSRKRSLASALSETGQADESRRMVRSAAENIHNYPSLALLAANLGHAQLALELLDTFRRLSDKNPASSLLKTYVSDIAQTYALLDKPDDADLPGDFRAT